MTDGGVTESNAASPMDLLSPRTEASNKDAVTLQTMTIIDLAGSGEVADGDACSPGHLTLDNNMSHVYKHLYAQHDRGQMQQDTAEPSLKRRWGEMSDDQQDSRDAPAMHWGTTRPRLQRIRTGHPTMQPEHQSVASAVQQPGSTAQPRQVTDQVARLRSRRMAAAAPAPAPMPATPAIVIDECEVLDSPIMVAKVTGPVRQPSGNSYGTAAAARRAGGSSSGSHRAAAPRTIQGNPAVAGMRGMPPRPSSGHHRSNQHSVQSVPPGRAAAAHAAEVTCEAGSRLRTDRQLAGCSTHGSGSGSGGSSRSSGNHSDVGMARRSQEEEDAALARQLMLQERQQAMQREAAERYRLRMQLYQEMDNLQEAEAAAAAVGMPTAAGSTRARRSSRAPQQISQHAAVEQQLHYHYRQQQQQRRWQSEDDDPQAAASSARRQHWGVAMAHALMQLPVWGGGGPAHDHGHRGGPRGLPPGLAAMREAVMGMQRAGLPAHMLFSDRDFTADDYELLCRLDETVENRKGASASTIEGLPTQTVPSGGITGTAGEKLSCAVCLEEFAEGAELRLLPCLHKFHKDCIDRWLGQKAACPVCNRECQ